MFRTFILVPHLRINESVVCWSNPIRRSANERITQKNITTLKRTVWWVWKLKKQTYLHLFFGSIDDKTAAQNLVVIDKKKSLGFFQPLSPKQNIASVDSKERDSAVRPLQQLLLLEEKIALEWKCRGQVSPKISLNHWSWYLLLSNMMSHELSSKWFSSSMYVYIYISIYGTRMRPYVCFGFFSTLPIHDKLISMGSQSCKPQQTWSIWPCLHHQQTMASTSFGRRSDAAKRASKLQKAVLFYGKNSSGSMESARCLEHEA